MSCALCALKLPKNPFVDEKHFFCCKGCLIVYKIIGTQKNYQTHPLFQEALKAGILSYPQEENHEVHASEETQKLHVHIQGMWCPSCAEAIQLIVKKKKGVQSCVVDYATDLAIISINPCLTSKEQILALIHSLGYIASDSLVDKGYRSKSLILRLIVAIFCAMNIMMCSYPLYAAHFGQSVEGYESTLGWFSFALGLPILTFSAWPIWKKLKISVISRLLGMETLVFLGVFAAFVFSTFHLIQGVYTQLYFDSSAMVICFVLGGRILENRAKFSSKEIWLNLLQHLPNKANKKVNEGEYAYVPIKDIVCGDLLLVRTGEKIVLDGTVVQGIAFVDEAIITGEVKCIEKTKGSEVIAGSFVKQGSIVLQVSKTQEQSFLGRIVELIEKDLMNRRPELALIDSITRFFVPVLILVASAILALFGPVRALSVLLIACPCAMGVAAPLALSRLLFRFAQKGAIVRNRSRLPVLSKNPLFIFDKTGTLTEGKFQVLQGLENIHTTHKRILKALTLHSRHPVSFALSEAISLPPLCLEQIFETPGRGVHGFYEGKKYFLGSYQVAAEKK